MNWQMSCHPSWKKWATALGLGLVCAVTPRAHATDHLDGSGTSQVKTDPATDIGDVFAWMDSTGGRVNLAMTVFPGATASSKFSTTTLYYFHSNSKVSATDSSSDRELPIICSFSDGTPASAECWAGANEYVKGDASSTAGIVSASKKLQVFAGLRSEPAFWNRNGYNNAVALINTAQAAGVDAGAGCKPLAMAVRTPIFTALNQTTPTDTFGTAATRNTLAIVVSVDRSLLAPQGRPVLAIWGSTNKKL